MSDERMMRDPLERRPPRRRRLDEAVAVPGAVPGAEVVPAPRTDPADLEVVAAPE